MISIYTLTDPYTNKVFYVGKTKNPLRYRLRCHYKAKGESKVVKYIAKLKRKGGRPIIEEVENCAKDKQSETEGFWINQFKCWGFELCNTNFNTAFYFKSSVVVSRNGIKYVKKGYARKAKRDKGIQHYKDEVCRLKKQNERLRKKLKRLNKSK